MRIQTYEMRLKNIYILKNKGAKNEQQKIQID